MPSQHGRWPCLEEVMANSLKNGRSLVMRTQNFTFMACFSTTCNPYFPHAVIFPAVLPSTHQIPDPPTSPASNARHICHNFRLSLTSSHTSTLFVSLHLSSDSVACFTACCTPILVTSLYSPVCSTYSPIHRTIPLFHCLALP